MSVELYVLTQRILKRTLPTLTSDLLQHITPYNFCTLQLYHEQICIRQDLGSDRHEGYRSMDSAGGSREICPCSNYCCCLGCQVTRLISLHFNPVLFFRGFSLTTSLFSSLLVHLLCFLRFLIGYPKPHPLLPSTFYPHRNYSSSIQLYM